MLSKELEITLNVAFKSARKNHHEFMTVEHLLLALLDNEIACNVLKSCNCDLNELRISLEQFIDTTTPLLDDSCLLYTSPSPRDPKTSRMPSSA